MFMKLFAICLTAAVLGACAGLKVGPGWEGEQVVGEGMAPYDGKNLPAARANALAAAQRNAVEQVVGVFVTGQTMVQKAVAIEQKVLAKTQGFIKRYKVLDEGADNGYYRIKIKAVVLLQDVSAALEEMRLSESKRGGKIMVFTSETISGKPSKTNDARGGIYRVLSKRSYAIAESETPLDPAQGNDTLSLLELTRAAGAAFLIIAQADAYKLEEMSQLGSAFIPCRAKINLKLMSVNSGQVVAESTKEASGVDAVEKIAAQKALSAAAELAAQDILVPLETATRSGTSIMLKVVSLSGLEQLKKLQDALRNIGGVEDFSLTRYTRGDAFFSVHVSGISGEELTASILRQKPFELEAQVVTQYEIQLKAN